MSNCFYPIGVLTEIIIVERIGRIVGKRRGLGLRIQRGAVMPVDIFLGDLWGLNTAKVDFDTLERMDNFIPPPFAVFEVTNNPFFSGTNLAHKKFQDIQAEIAIIGSGTPLPSILSDE